MTYTRIRATPGMLYYAAIPTRLFHQPGNEDGPWSIKLSESELLLCLATEFNDDSIGWAMCVATTNSGPRIGWVFNDNLRFTGG